MSDVAENGEEGREPEAWLVVATRNRPEELRRLLRTLRGQSRPPEGVVVVDASDAPVTVVEDPEAVPFTLRHITRSQPSSAGQRNAGVEAVPESADLVAFADDDAVFAPDAWARMLDFWREAPDDVGGAGFNMLNHPEPVVNRLRGVWPLERLGLFTAEPGGVPLSGWGTLPGRVARSLEVEWLPATAVVWRSEVVREQTFDEGLGAYSLLEDLDFSYRAGRDWRLVMVPDALYWHLPASDGRPAGRGFGRLEVRNRLRFVRRAGLSELRCWMALLIRSAATLLAATARLDLEAYGRFVGNLAQMVTEVRIENPAAARQEDGCGV